MSPLAVGPEPAVQRLRLVGPSDPPAHRVSGVVGSDLVAQLVRSFGTYGRVAVPALGHPAAQPEALDQVGAVPVPAQVVKRSFPVTHGSKLYQVWQPC